MCLCSMGICPIIVYFSSQNNLSILRSFHTHRTHPIWYPVTCTLSQTSSGTPKETHFTSYKVMKEAVKSWIKERPAIYFSDAMKKNVTCWDKYVSVNGDFVEK